VPTCEGGHKVKVGGHCKKIFRRFVPERECPSTFTIAPAPMVGSHKSDKISASSLCLLSLLFRICLLPAADLLS